ncbi:hypothetical protein [Brevibacterium sp. CFH 10365]|nr:hypothetical protein [Brevibacterium sp. CFH 10365]
MADDFFPSAVGSALPGAGVHVCAVRTPHTWTPVGPHMRVLYR